MHRSLIALVRSKRLSSPWLFPEQTPNADGSGGGSHGTREDDREIAGEFTQSMHAFGSMQPGPAARGWVGTKPTPKAKFSPSRKSSCPHGSRNKASAAAKAFLHASSLDSECNPPPTHWGKGVGMVQGRRYTPAPPSPAAPGSAAPPAPAASPQFAPVRKGANGMER